MKPQARSWHWVIAAGLVAICMFVVQLGSATGADKLPKFKKGDKLEVEFLGKWIPAEFVEYFPTGWLTVKHANNVSGAPPIQRTIPPDNCRVSKTAKPAGGKSSSSSASSSEQKERTWTDVTGKHKVVAKFSAVADGKVVLIKADGKEVKIPLDKLSEADRKMADELAKGGGDDNPFESAEEESMPEKEEVTKKNPTDGEDPEGITLKTPDWTEGGAITVLEGTPEILKEDPQPAAMGTLAKKGAVLAGGNPSDVFENAKGVFFDPATSRCVIAYVAERPGQSKTIELETVDLVAGKSLGKTALKGNGTPRSLSPSGKMLICRSDALHSGTKARVDVWSLDGSEAKSVMSFKPHGDKDVHQRDVKTTAFINDKMFYTVDHQGQLTTWDLAGVKALYSFGLAGSGADSAPVAVSGTGKYMALLTKSGVCVVDPANGTILAKYECPTIFDARLSFSPDGKFLAVAAAYQLLVWDITTGVQVHDIFVPSGVASNLLTSPDAAIEWVANGYVLLGGRSLVDLNKKILLWDYAHTAEAFGAFGGYHWYVQKSDDRSKRGLFHVTLPHGGASQAAEKLDPETMMVIKPGTEIALNISAAMPDADRQKVFNGMTQRLTEMGMRVVPQAKITIDAFSQPGTPRQVSYRSIGGFGRNPFGGGDGTFTATPVTMTFGIREGDTVLWKTSVTRDVPFVLHTDNNKTMQQAADESVRPTPEFYLGQPLPKFMARPGKANGAFGSSKLTSSGVELSGPAL